MRYSNAGEIIVMTIVWAVVLLVIDNTFNRPAEQAQPAQPQAQMEFPQPQVAMVVRHVGCSDQYKEVERALQTLPWLRDVQVKRGESLAQAEGVPQKVVPMPEGVEAVRPEQPEELCTVRVLAVVQSIEQVDFMEIPRTLRDIGIVPTTLVFGGIPHFALQAKVSDLSCDTCVQAAKDALTPLPVSASYYFSASNRQPSETDVLRASKLTTFTWLGDKLVNSQDNTITAHVLQNHTARVGEMIRALEGAGLLPLSIRIVVEKA
jgi:copper chaperone CopZ